MEVVAGGVGFEVFAESATGVSDFTAGVEAGGGAGGGGGGGFALGSGEGSWSVDLVAIWEWTSVSRRSPEPTRAHFSSKFTDLKSKRCRFRGIKISKR